jgi:hypothetical protein
MAAPIAIGVVDLPAGRQARCRDALRSNTSAFTGIRPDSYRFDSGSGYETKGKECEKPIENDSSHTFLFCTMRFR